MLFFFRFFIDDIDITDFINLTRTCIVWAHTRISLERSPALSFEDFINSCLMDKLIQIPDPLYMVYLTM